MLEASRIRIGELFTDAVSRLVRPDLGCCVAFSMAFRGPSRESRHIVFWLLE